MKVNPPSGTLAAVVVTGLLLCAATGTTLAQGARLATRPLTPQEIKDYALPAGTQKSGGLFTVGIGQPLYLEAQVDIGTAVTGVTWALTSKPSGSVAAFAATPIRPEMPIYNPGDRAVSMVAGRTLLVPDIAGQYAITATVTTDAGDLVVTGAATAATYVGVGHVGSAIFPECALCHTDKVEGWHGTGHSWTLEENLDGQGSDHFNANCVVCHSTGYDTAPAAVNAGFDDIAALVGWTFPPTLEPGNWDAMDPALQAKGNVQCEACHGPGSEHFGRFDRISVSTSSGDCAQCHDSVAHHNKTQEWNASRHAIATRYPTGESRASCVRCHSGIGFIDYADGLAQSEFRTGYEAIVCAACHDPHAGSNPHQLRTVADITLATGDVITQGGNGKLCMNCHQGRRDAQSTVDSMGSVSGSFGAHHGPQADMLAGKNAYEYDRPMRSSGHIYAVGDSCVTCHLQEVASSDPGFLNVGGHTFVPGWDGGTPDDPSDDVHLTEGCASCHGDLESFDSIVRQDYDGNGIAEGTQTEVKGLLHQLALLLPPYGSPDVVPSNAYTKEERGALWNYRMVEEDGSFGVHNTLYATDVLKTSIAILSGESQAGDADNDCLPDDWEIAQFGDITTYDASDDPDFDGVNNRMEYSVQTNPMLADSDSDGFNDYQELHMGTDPNNASDSPELHRTQMYTAAEMVFATEAGKTYQVQSVSQVGEGNWVNHGEPFQGTGDMMQLFISTRETQAQFYRVVETP